jgi:hypothetical protein
MTRTTAVTAFALIGLAAALAPTMSTRDLPGAAMSATDWPSHYEGRPIAAIPAAPEDALLASRFPGQVARFSDGRRQIVLRRMASATRRLHPARDCFRATGHAIAPAPMRVTRGQAASCFSASRTGRTLLVCEQVRDARGRSWPDIPSWYWSAAFGTSDGPWTAALTVERGR